MSFLFFNAPSSGWFNYFFFCVTSSKHSDCGGVFEVDLTVSKIGDVTRYLIEKHVVERVSMEADVE